MAKEKSALDEAYDQFKRDVGFLVREIKKFIRSGEALSREEITSMFDLLFVNLANDLDDIDPAMTRRYIDKAEKYLITVETRLVGDEEFQDVIEEASENNTAELSIVEGYITLNGIEYAIIDQNEAVGFERRGIKRRGRTITSLSELEEYVEGIPTVQAIEVVYNVNGVIVGYRVWISDKS